MNRALLLVCLAVLGGCAQRRIGELSVSDHLRAGRLREALAALEREDRSNPFLGLHRATLLHGAGRYAESEAAFEAAPQARLHPVELRAVAQLRALNRAALSQDEAALEPILARAQRILRPLGDGEAGLLVLIERGWAPQLTATPDPSDPSAEPFVSIAAPAKLAAAPLRLDAEEPFEAELLVDDQRAWEAATLAAYEGRREALAGSLDLGALVAFRQQGRVVWWSPPTQLWIAERPLRPGPHVLLVPTPGGLRERRIDLVAGERLIVVTRR